MKTQGKTTHLGRVLIGLLGLMFAQTTFAVGTLSGTSITNDATVNYSSGGVAQTPVTSAPAVFVVDNMVDVLVAEISDSAAVVVPGQLVAGFVDPQILGFTVTNEGNTAQDYALVAANLADGASVPFTAALTDSNSATSDATNITMYQDGGNGIFDGTDVVVTFLNAMAADETRTVWVLADIPAGAVNGAVIGVSLQATTHDSTSGVLDPLTAETVGADTPGSVDVVFADDFPAVTSTDDGAVDGQASDRDAFLVQAAVLTIVKASAVISDPFNGTTNPLAVPGAIVEYTITVTNTGTAQATTVTIADDLSVEIGAGRIAFTSNQYGVGNVFDIQLDINAVVTDLTEEADADQGVFAANIVTVNAVTLNPADVATVSFRVTIQ